MEGYNSSFTGAQIDEAVRKVINGESADMAAVQEYADTHWLGEEVFIVSVLEQYDSEKNVTYTADRSYSDITAAVNSGKKVYAMLNGMMIPYIKKMGSNLVFNVEWLGIQLRIRISDGFVTVSDIGRLMLAEGLEVENGDILLRKGNLSLAKDPTLPLQAATKQYVDNAVQALRNELMQQG